MRRRPLCIVFLSLVILIAAAKASGLSLWNEPGAELRDFSSEISGTECVIFGTVASREEKTNSISYFLKDSYLLTDTTFKEADSNSYLNGSVYLHNIQLYTSKEASEIKIGSEIVIFGEPQVYENAGNPGGFDQAYYYAADDCCISIYSTEIRILSEADFSIKEVFASLRERLRQNLNELMDEDAAAALSAMLFGIRSDLTTELKLDYSAAGLSHLLAISGMHVALIGGLLYKLLCRIGIRSACILSVAFMIVYCVFTGSSESTVRAVIMFSVMNLAKCTLRSYDGLSALSLAGIIILAVSPMSLFRAGFQLSFAAVLSTSCILPVLKKRFTKDDNTKTDNVVKKQFTRSVLLWASINLGTFPIVLYHFFEFPIYSVITNLIFVPFVSIVVIVGFLGAVMSLFFPTVAGAVLFVPEMLLSLQNGAGDIVLKLPYPILILGRPHMVQIVLFYTGLVISMLLLSRQRRVGSKPLPNKYRFRRRQVFPVFVLLFLVFLRLPEGFSITALDVGQGDCIFIQEAGLTYIVDGGSSSESSVGEYTIIPYIKSQAISTIEGIFLTHADSDHTSGIEELLIQIANKQTVIRVNNIFMPYWMADTEDGDYLSYLASEAGADISFLSGEDMVSFGEVQIRILSPQINDGLEGNAGSLVLSVGFRGFSALLTGDLEEEGEDMLLESLGEFDYLKVAHHGSRNSGSDEFYARVSPSVCIISAPVDSIYGHPHSETLQRIEDAGADMFWTGVDGAVTVRIDGGKMVVETYR